MARDDLTIRLHLHRMRVLRVLVDTVKSVLMSPVLDRLIGHTNIR